MNQVGVQLNLYKKSKKSRGLGGRRQPPPMMLEEVMIYMGVLSNLCKQSKKLRGGWAGGGSPPHDV